jgi:hypothetical protein
MTIKKKICYKDRLACYDTNTIKNIIENRIKTEKYMEKKNGKTKSIYIYKNYITQIVQSPLFNFCT